MHAAEEYLRKEGNPNSLYIRYDGRKRRLFVNEKDGAVGIVAIGKRTHGHHFFDWNGISKIFLPQDKAPVDESRITHKFIREAKLASFTNPFIRKCLAADPKKSPYENGLTAGTDIDGKLISLDTLRKWMPSMWYQLFIKAMQTRESFMSPRFTFQGYEGTIEVRVYKENDTYLRPGEIIVYFNKEYIGCLNGYYYIMINEQYFIGNDID